MYLLLLLLGATLALFLSSDRLFHNATELTIHFPGKLLLFSAIAPSPQEEDRLSHCESVCIAYDSKVLTVGMVPSSE